MLLIRQLAYHSALKMSTIYMIYQHKSFKSIALASQRCPWVHFSKSNPTQSTSLLTQSNPIQSMDESNPWTSLWRRSLILGHTRSPRLTNILLALGYPLFKQLRDKIVQSRRFSSFARELSHTFL